MTHDELLEEFDRWIRFLADKNKGKEWVKALRAVVELHKPETGWSDGVEVENHHCSCDPYNEYDMGYPCETIQVIKEQLK
jgi:hypothetical protein